MESHTNGAAPALQEKALAHIKEQTGMTFELCDCFSEIKLFNGYPYFNIILKNAVSESREYQTLERLCATSSTLREIQPNGLNRVAVICNP